ncbi:MAG: DASS family sodium-coupled anion symporter [Spirochaetaceae bacterium]|nr:MAG: DASS family sodium-coupled anion symporter [Spirochaetaceae bacterium]
MSDTQKKKAPGLELSRGTRWAFLGVAFAIALAAFLFPLPESIRTVNELTLTPQGQTTMGILLFALLLWVSEAIPFHLTGLIGMILIALFGVTSFTQVVSIGFGNHIFVFFIGVLILSSFITRSGLGNRISVYLLSKTGNSTSAIIFGFLVAGMFLSMWITNTAVAAMLMPLGVAILKEEGVPPLKSNFGKALMIACAWGPIVGGLMAPSGAGPNPIAIGFLKEMVGIELTFVGWMLYGVPAGILLLFPTWWILLLFFKPEMKRLKKSKEELRAAYAELPPMDREQKVTLVLFATTVVLWLITPLLEALLGVSIPISLPVMITGALFFFPGVATTTWEKVEKEISWSSILLIVSGISLGMVLYQTGAAEWLAIAMLGGVGGLHPFLLVLLVVLIVEFLKVFLSSNTVTATIVIPIMITLAANLGIDALSITMPAALSTSMAFILVTSTPTNVIPYTAGYFSIRDMAVAGLVMTLIAAPIVAATIFIIGGFTGLY